jgi:multiple sugar transport system permease protein
MPARVGARNEAPDRQHPMHRLMDRFDGSVVPYLFVLPAALFMVGLMIYPTIFNVQISFQEMTAGNLLSGGAEWVGLANYEAMLADPRFTTAFTNSLIFTVASMVFQIGIGLALALFYNQDFPGNLIMRPLYLVAYAVPVIVVASVFNWLLDGQYGVINWVLRSLGIIDGPIFWLNDVNTALGGVIFINIWLGIPFNLTVLLAGLKSIPRELYEAAEVDGAGRLTKFRHITLPLLRPALLAVAMLGIIFTFKMFDVVWVATKGGPAGASDVLPTLSFKLVFEQFLFGKGAAVLNVMFLFLFVLSLIYLRVLNRQELRK